MRLTKFNPETGQYEYIEKAKTLDEYRAQRKAAIQKLGEYEDQRPKYMAYSDGRIEVLGHNDPVGEPGECGLKRKCIADTVRKIQSELQERCIKGGIYPAFVARTIDQIAKEMLEGENDS